MNFQGFEEARLSFVEATGVEAELAYIHPATWCSVKDSLAGWHLHYDPEVGEDRIHGVKITTSELITPGFLTLVRQKAVNDPGLFGAKNLAKPLVMYFDSLGKEISK